jgi:hypothetical protein
MELIIYAFIIISILVLLFGFAIYLARGEEPKREHYGSWSNVLGPQFRGSAYDVAENLNKEIEEGRGQSHRTRRSRRSREKRK